MHIMSMFKAVHSGRTAELIFFRNVEEIPHMNCDNCKQHL